jgi:hypothetical protein
MGKTIRKLDKLIASMNRGDKITIYYDGSYNRYNKKNSLVISGKIFDEISSTNPITTMNPLFESLGYSRSIIRENVSLLKERKKHRKENKKGKMVYTGRLFPIIDIVGLDSDLPATCKRNGELFRIIYRIFRNKKYTVYFRMSDNTLDFPLFVEDDKGKIIERIGFREI